MAGPTSTLPHLVGAFRQRGGPHVAQPNPVGVIRASVVGPTLALPHLVEAFRQRGGPHVAWLGPRRPCLTLWVRLVSGLGLTYPCLTM